jgi:hypothetical protein
MALRFKVVVTTALTTILTFIGHGVKALPSNNLSTSICTANDFDLIRTNLSGNFKLVCDVDLSSKNPWTPIGKLGAGFSGTFDGDGHTISNLTGDGGLFGANTGTIKNVKLVNVSIKRLSTSVASLQNVGSLVGMNGDYGCYPSTADRPQLIANCSATGKIEIDRGWNIGGLVGNNCGVILGSFADIRISDTGATTNPSSGAVTYTNIVVGGLAGVHWHVIKGSFAKGSVSGGHSVGGLVGLFLNGGTYNAWNPAYVKVFGSLLLLDWFF